MAMVAARIGDSECVIGDYEITMKGALVCKCCGQPVVAKRGAVKVHHFAHKSRAACDPWRVGHAMTEWHKGWQTLCRPEFLEKRIERDGTWHIADIVTKGGTVVEVQHSTMIAEKLKDREDFYGNMIWILDGRSSDDLIEVRGSDFIILSRTPLFWNHLAKPAFVDTVLGVSRLAKKIAPRSWLAERPKSLHRDFFDEYLSGITKEVDAADNFRRGWIPTQAPLLKASYNAVEKWVECGGSYSDGRLSEALVGWCEKVHRDSGATLFVPPEFAGHEVVLDGKDASIKRITELAKSMWKFGQFGRWPGDFAAAKFLRARNAVDLGTGVVKPYDVVKELENRVIDRTREEVCKHLERIYPLHIEKVSEFTATLGQDRLRQCVVTDPWDRPVDNDELFVYFQSGFSYWDDTIEEIALQAEDLWKENEFGDWPGEAAAKKFLRAQDALEVVEGNITAVDVVKELGKDTYPDKRATVAEFAARSKRDSLQWCLVMEEHRVPARGIAEKKCDFAIGGLGAAPTTAEGVIRVGPHPCNSPL